jgi:hypothetical protein
MSKKHKKLIFILMTFIAIIVGFNLIFNLTLGTKEYRSKNAKVTFNIPNFSIFKEECCMFSASFRTVRTTKSIRKEIEKELKNYEKISCNNDTYYYNQKQDLTITEYYIKKGFIFNEFSIVFVNGNYCE